jgi:siderophore synthetase component
MSALAVVDPQRRVHFFDTLGADASQALDWFGDVCDAFFEVVMRLLRLGVVPEIHGQNVVLAFERGQVSGILLRDFDTTRLHLPWLSAAGLNDPAYVVKPNRPNSLYNDSPADLLFYIQTLGIQVNLYAIIDALAGRYRISAAQGWRVLGASLRRSLRRIEFSADQRRLIEDRLFDQPTWPTKLCVTPLLEQEGGAIGSMPAGKGRVRNPLLGGGECGL